MFHKKKWLILLSAISLLCTIVACGGACNHAPMEEEVSSELPVSQFDVDTEQSEEKEAPETMDTKEYLTEIPNDYFHEASQKGKVTEVTYDSLDYTVRGYPIKRTAVIYTPFGYDASDENTRYNVVYLMHGWKMTAWDFFTRSRLINILDRMIETGDLPPTIVVCATFDAENRSQDFLRSFDEMVVFRYDFRENLVPFVDSIYNTFPDREHRAFAGFSMGAFITWFEFCYDLDLVKYFVPMSGDCWIYGVSGGLYCNEQTVDRLEKAVADCELDERDFYVWQGIGTDDALFTQTDNQITEMFTRDTFTPYNLHYGVFEGGKHDVFAVERYLYHALPTLFKE